MGKHKRKAQADDGNDAKRGKPANGDYPPPHVLESAAFESYYRECGVVPEGEFDDFMSTLRQPLGVSFRVTGHPEDADSVSMRDYMERHHLQLLDGLELDGQPVPAPYEVKWYPGRMAWRFDVSRNVLRGKGVHKGEETPAARTLAAFHAFLTAETELGTISRQEEVSMVPPCLLDVRPGHLVADLCAAPGSKTQQLIESLHPPGQSTGREVGPSGLVVANDMDYRRCHLLVHQAKRLHSPSLVVTNHDATMLPTRYSAAVREPVAGERASCVAPSDRLIFDRATCALRFDRILCDVPCSGDGTLRKAPDLWRRWTDGLATGVHRMQLAILSRALQVRLAPANEPRRVLATHALHVSSFLARGPTAVYTFLFPLPVPSTLCISPCSQMLQPGGRLVYSTCSMNPIEDEAVVAAALLEVAAKEATANEAGAVAPLAPTGYSLIDVSASLPELRRNAGVPSWRVRADGVWYDSFEQVPEPTREARKLLPTMFAPPAATLEALHIERCLRVLPHMQNTGGFFIAVIAKSDAPPTAPSTAAVPPAVVHVSDPAPVAAATDASQSGPVAASAPAAAAASASSTDAALTAVPSATPLVSRIPEQKNVQQGPHVLRALHCGARNHGKYDALYELTPAWHAQLAAFLGLGCRASDGEPARTSAGDGPAPFPQGQLMTRSITGKAIFLIGVHALPCASSDPEGPVGCSARIPSQTWDSLADHSPALGHRCERPPSLASRLQRQASPRSHRHPCSGAHRGDDSRRTSIC